MKLVTVRIICSAALSLWFVPTEVKAQNSAYAPGDLVLFFQQEGGSNTVYANLGNAATAFRGAATGAADGVNQINFLDLSAELEAAFGESWAQDPSVYAGLAGVWGTSQTNLVALQDGDPNRTLYISKARQSVGVVGVEDSSPWDLTLAGNTAMTSAATGILSQNNVLETQGTAAIEVVPTSTSQIDNQNPFLAPGILGNAMANTLEGGVQQVGSTETFGTFDGAGEVEFALDLYRVLAINTAPGQVAGDVRVGSYEGTVTVNTAGKVSFIAKEQPKTPFQTWALSFPGLDTDAKRLPDANPDGDSLTNLEEFLLNGNPSVSNNSVAPKRADTSTAFVSTFKRRDDSQADYTFVFRYRTSKKGAWNNVGIGAKSKTVGQAVVTVVENSKQADSITVTIPKSVSAGGKFYTSFRVDAN